MFWIENVHWTVKYFFSFKIALHIYEIIINFKMTCHYHVMNSMTCFKPFTDILIWFEIIKAIPLFYNYFEQGNIPNNNKFNTCI